MAVATPADDARRLDILETENAELKFRMAQLEQTIQAAAATVGFLNAPPVGADGAFDGDTDTTENPLDRAGNSVGNVVNLAKVTRHIKQLTEAPSSLHQLTASIALDSSESSGRQTKYIAGSFSVVVLQLLVTVGLGQGIKHPSCKTNADCSAVRGNLCSLGSSTTGDCEQCLFDDFGGPDPLYESKMRGAWFSIPPHLRDQDLLPNGDYPYPGAKNAREFCALANLTEYPGAVSGCEACFDPLLQGDGWNIALTEHQVWYDAVTLMRTGDWVALMLVVLLLSMYISNEVRDVKLCQLLVAQRSDTCTPSWVKRSLMTLSAIRQFGHLPYMIVVNIELLLWRGTDALSLWCVDQQQSFHSAMLTFRPASSSTESVGSHD